MFGTVGVPEMAVIFIVALVLFGPKKLPELGRTIGKAITEFRRATSELKSSFEREMHALERETESLKDATNSADQEIRSHSTYEYQPYDEMGYPILSNDSTATNPATVSASEVPGAESHGTSETASYYEQPVEPAPGVEGTVPRTHEDPKPAVETPQHS
ncbi:MAG: TatA/E family twin arginine-targeting protein translocase [Bryobacteraceae bacterium]|jgi:sec-independent protein translocase protein TatA